MKYQRICLIQDQVSRIGFKKDFSVIFIDLKCAQIVYKKISNHAINNYCFFFSEISLFCKLYSVVTRAVKLEKLEVFVGHANQ